MTLSHLQFSVMTYETLFLFFFYKLLNMTRRCVVIGDNLISLAIANAFAKTSEFSTSLLTSRQQTHNVNGLRFFACNLTDSKQVDTLFEDLKPNVVIHW
jgi:hypothetical protein